MIMISAEDEGFFNKERKYFDDGLKIRRVYGDGCYKTWVDEWYKYKAARKEGKEAVDKYISSIKERIPSILKKRGVVEWFDQ